MIFRGRALAHVGKIGTETHFPEHNRSGEDVIARRAATLAPFSIDIGRQIIGANLLTMTIETAVAGVNFTAAFGHSRRRHWIDVGAFLVHLRIEMSDLLIRNDGQSDPGKGERAK